ncbi:MAG: 6-phosphofructokinase, partial [Anaerolineae bacterium]
MARAKRVGILTGGGDVPGLNPAIKAVVETAVSKNWDVVGVRLGWGGLLNYNPDRPETGKKLVIPLTQSAVRTIDRSGGTFLHTSRTNPQRVRAADVPDFLVGTTEPADGEGDAAIYDFTPHVLKALEHLGVDAMIPIGGDDTL